MKKFSFSRIARLRRHTAFEAVFNKGLKIVSRDLVLWAFADAKLTADTKQSPATAGKQVGLVISKKAGGAVQRNRIKRLLREAFRTSAGDLKNGTKMIIYPKAGCAIRSLADAKKALNVVWARARILDLNGKS